MDADHQRLLIILHAARDAARRRLDVSHVRTESTDAEWDRLRHLAGEFDAAAAWEAATDEPLPGTDPRATALFRAMNSNKSGLELFGARWRAADGALAKARLVRDTLGVNRAHLAMDLGREVTHGDALAWQLGRVRQITAWAAGRLLRPWTRSRKGSK